MFRRRRRSLSPRMRALAVLYGVAPRLSLFQEGYFAASMRQLADIERAPRREGSWMVDAVLGNLERDLPVLLRSCRSHRCSHRTAPPA